MKVYFILTFILCIVMVFFPFLSKFSSGINTDGESTSQQFSQQTDKTTEKSSNEIKVLRTSTDEVSTVSLFDYIVGVIAGEMPASFCTEALKAQAVVSYTYAKWLSENSSSTESSDITDSSALHQKYIDKKEQKEKWQDTYQENRERIEEAVKSVFGEYVAYNGETAMTVFHALSSGYTLSANEVWGKDIPYLTQVECPGDTLAEKYESVISFTPEEFKKVMENDGEIELNAESFKSWAKVKEKSSNGFIKVLTVGGKDFSARDIRKILSLGSNSFKATIKDGCFVFTVYGRGHGVGMSQYSADYMARQGSTYTEILEHFYPEAELIKP